MTEENKETESSGQTETPEMVSVGDDGSGLDEVSDEVLDALIAGESLSEEEHPQEEPANPEEAQPDGEEAKAEDAAPEQGKQQSKEVEDLQAALKRIDVLEKQTIGQERLIHRQISKLGEERKQLQAIAEQLRGGLKEKFLEDPAAAVDDQLKLKQAEEAIEQIDATAENLVHVEENRATFSKYVKKEEVFPDEMKEILVEDGFDPVDAEGFLRNPFNGKADAPFLIQLAKRGRDRKALKYIIPAFKKLEAAHKELQTKYDQLQKSGPRALLRKVEEATNQPPRLNGKSGAAKTKTVALTSRDMERLSDKELDDIIAGRIGA